jgi:glycoside/pentoside/hexuronide:cation symporter, GPH family
MADTVVRAKTIATADERLPLSTKLAFGAGDLAPAIATFVPSFFQFFFLTSVAGLDPLLAGSIRAILSIWDAVNDPMVGWLSDRTRSRLGRRRPWLLYGAVPFGLLYFAQWIIPPFDDTGKFIYYLIVGLFFNIAFTAVNVPYTALTAELTQDYDERTSLNTFRFAFSIGGSLLTAVLHPAIVAQYPDNPAMGFLVSGAVWGGLCILPFFWCVAGTRERYQDQPVPTDTAIIPQFLSALRNRPYLFVVGIYLFSWLAVQFTSSILVPYVTFWLGSVPQFPAQALGLTFNSTADIVPIMLLAVQGSAFLCLFMWNAVCRRIGKKAVYMIGMVFWIAVQSVLFFVQPDQIGLAIILAVLAGVGVATAYIVPWSMMPDVIEYDELLTGQRREGIFYGLMVLLQKFGLALGQFLTGFVLQMAGFISTEGLADIRQPDSALLALRWMIGPIPTVVLICGMILTAFYPITREKHAELLAQLEAKKQG